jgi:hypothetical protein
MKEISMNATRADAVTVPAPRRYLIQRTFPAGALEGVTPDVKKQVNANNQALGVTWEHSYANADKTKTFCIYTGPNEAAVREAAKRNQLPVDFVTEIPFVLSSK